MPDLLSLVVLVYLGCLILILPLADWVQRRIAKFQLHRQWLKRLKAQGVL